MQVRWTVRALRDLESIEDHIARDDPSAAYEVAQRIRAAVMSQLPEHPNLGRPGRIRGTRELVIAGLPYIVAYRVQSGEIQILVVRHTARRWSKRLMSSTPLISGQN